MITKERQFVKQFGQFKKLASSGEPVEVRDKSGLRFLFVLLPVRQRPPRRAARPLDPSLFKGLDWDEPALPPQAWEANR